MTAAERATTVHTLLCHQHVGMAVVCLGSLLRHASAPTVIVIHDDGSLSEGDTFSLRQALPGCAIIGRPAADERMADDLRRFPHSFAFRAGNNMALKLFDTVYYCSESQYRYVDGDVLFFRPWAAAFADDAARPPAVFLKDVRNGLSVHFWDYAVLRGVRYCSLVNAGMMSLRRGSYDPEFIEWFLGRVRWARGRQWSAEQTVWAAVAGRVGGALWDSRYLCMAGPEVPLSGDLVAAHFFGPQRHLLEKFALIAASGRRGGEARVGVPVTPCATYGVWQMATDEICGKIGRLWRGR